MIPPFTKFNLIKLSCLLYATTAGSVYAQQDANKPTNPAPVAEKAANPAAQALAGTIYFFNGDSITGQLNSWDKDQVSITSPDLVDPVTFSTKQILNITLKDNRENAIKVDAKEDETTLIINNRDNQKGLHGIIKGSFSNIDEKHVTLNTKYAGEIKVLKKFVTRMEIDSKKGYVYLGPNSLEEWHDNSITKDRWIYRNNSLITGSKAGNISKDIATPAEASLSFDLSWKDDEYITLYLFSSDHEQSRPDTYYQLSLQRGRVSLIKYVDGRQSSDLTSELRGKRDPRFNNIRINRRITPKNKELHARYDIHMSKVKGEFHIFRNGVKLDTYTDSKPQPDKFGKALHIISSTKTPIRIKNLSLSKWSGHIPSVVDAETFAKVKGDGERILLKNGDILLGKIGKVRDGLMQVETLYAPFNIPIVRMRSIDLTGSNTKEEPLMYEHDIKCWYKEKGWIILKPISIEGNTLTAHHQALGENKFDINIFKRIDLHIYSDEANASRTADSW